MSKAEEQVFREATGTGAVLVVGAGSAIAGACLNELYAQGYELFLCCRTQQKAEAVRAKLLAAAQSAAASQAPSKRVRPPIHCAALTLPASPEQLAQLFCELSRRCRAPLCGILLCSGLYAQSSALELCSDHDVADRQWINARLMREQELTTVNFNALLPLLQLGALTLLQSKLTKPQSSDREGSGRRPFIAVISSVAGMRGRASNYAYGASKAALSTYLSGMRQSMPDLFIMDLRPGLIQSPMLEGRKLPKSLTAKPEVVGRAFARALLHERDIVFAPWYWRFILGAMALLPEWIYKRLKL